MSTGLRMWNPWWIRQNRRVRRWAWRAWEAVLDLHYFGERLGQVAPAPVHAESHGVEATDFRLLRQLGPWFRFGPSDVAVDVGAGTGRVLRWWARHSAEGRFVGIECVPEVADALARRLKDEPRVSVIHGDAVDRLPEDATFLYVCNPFGSRTMLRLRDKLEAGLAAGRSYRILYCAAEHPEVFRSSPKWVVRELPVRAPGPWQPVLWIVPAG